MRRWIAAAVVAGVGLVALIALAAVATGVPAGDFTRDPTRLGEQPWYVGSVSLLTSMLWAVAAALSAFVAWLLPALRGRFVPLAGLAAVLAADDSLRLHDSVGPDHGLPEQAFAVLYAAAGVLLAVRLTPWRRGPAGELGRGYLVGCAALAASLSVDVVTHEAYLLEDGLKLIGAVVLVTLPLGAYAPHHIGERHEPDDGRQPADTGGLPPAAPTDRRPDGPA